MDVNDIDHILDLLQNSFKWIPITNDLNPSPYSTQSDYKCDNQYTVRCNSLVPYSTDSLFDFISNPMNFELFDPFIQKVTRNDDFYVFTETFPTIFEIPSAFHLVNMRTDVFNVSIHDFRVQPGFLQRTFYATKHHGDSAEFIIVAELGGLSLADPNVVFLTNSRIKKIVDDLVCYLINAPNHDYFRTNEKKMYKMMMQPDKKFNIVFHENQSFRISVNCDLTEMLVQGEVHHERVASEIINFITSDDVWNICFQFSSVLRESQQFKVSHKETVTLGEKACVDLTSGIKIGDGFGVICFTSAVDKDCFYSHNNVISVFGGAFIFLGTPQKTMKYGISFSFPFLQSKPLSFRKKALFNFGAVQLAMHAFASLNFQVGRQPLSFLGTNEASTKMLQCVYECRDMKEREVMAPVIAHSPILFLTNDLLLKIFCFLSSDEIAQMPFICRKFHSALVSQNGNLIYKNLFEKNLDITRFDKRMNVQNDREMNEYKKIFLEHQKVKNRYGKLEGVVEDLHTEIFSVCVTDNFIAANCGKRLLGIDADGVKKFTNYGHVKSIRTHCDHKKVNVLFKTGTIYQFSSFQDGTKIGKIEIDEVQNAKMNCEGTGVLKWGTQTEKISLSNEVKWKYTCGGLITCFDEYFEGKYLGNSDGEILVFDERSKEMRKKYIGHFGGVNGIECCENKIVSWGEDGFFRMWDVRNWKELDRKVHMGDLIGVKLYNRKIFSFANDKTVVVTYMTNNSLRNPRLLANTEKKISDIGVDDSKVVVGMKCGKLLILDYQK
ncbi:hypothetical protein EIN_096930 [Entamoeba invadens IP1]|uniref:F-box domain-containing protein n=1 Tax=Entamoeba invadens IP1 TaxID=370355 RepID=A0A0A1U6J1_ENTIV|nr:hypothetical protein EIN_096930 [Entamoeba invadens IP1]ELP87426.1 hypothetical protein EIN_096930 [Entamoeba invadens IP1]|eukprot:XP_004254197.1 hypothetical protein EIN_096930 [Entamoeba invadens IP1]